MCRNDSISLNMWFKRLIFGSFLVLVTVCECKVTDKQYASMPRIFHMDDYDHCMLLGDEALYCMITYELSPTDPKHPSEVWKVIQEVISDPYNYRHDWLRHGICVPITCPNISQEYYKNDTRLLKSVTKCYDNKHRPYGVKGNVTKMRCHTTGPIYNIDYIDIIVAIVLILYCLLVIFASFYEGIARYDTPETYAKKISQGYGKSMAILSLCRNWERLKTVKETPETIPLKNIQGIRVYSMILVILVHTVMVAFAGPVSNTIYLETSRERAPNIFLNSGGYLISSFLMISAWLLTYGFFITFDNKDKQIKFKDLLLAFVNRYLRLTPTMAIVIAIHCTWLRHVPKGPLVEDFVGEEFRRCRKNWWVNLLYLNTHIDPYNMCLRQTWYLSVDTQLFILELLVLWFIVKRKNMIPIVLTLLTVIPMIGVAATVYYYDVPISVWPYTERMYHMVTTDEWIWNFLVGGLYTNTAGATVGIGYGYLYYLYKDKKFFTNKFQVTLWWIICLCLPLGVIIIPGLIIYSDDYVPNIWITAFYTATGRHIFVLGIGYAIFGMSQGIGWVAKWICEWSPTYILGRLTYSVYMSHVTLLFIRGGYQRSNKFAADYILVWELFGDIGISILAGSVTTLFVEMPMSELLKSLVPAKNETTSKEDKSKDNSNKVKTT